MSRFLKPAYRDLKEYVPGEQYQNVRFIKLNTNESPYPPSPRVPEEALAAAKTLRLYSDPESALLREKLAGHLGVDPACLLLSNGSDEALNFAFMAYGDDSHPFVFPNYTYGFYRVLCDALQIPFRTVPLKADFTLDADDYLGVKGNIVIANPNAPTGIAHPVAGIERILRANPDSVVIVDEAYADFNDENCLKLLPKYNNLVIIRTFSKSWSLAGARLGYAVADQGLIADMNRVKNSIDPYNVNRMTAGAAMAAIDEFDYYADMRRKIISTRERTAAALREMGFEILPSKTNFVFARLPGMDGETLYRKLKEKGVLIRHFTTPGISDFNRITIGRDEEMDILFERIREIMTETKGS